MSTGRVSTINQGGKDSVDDVRNWLNQKASRGEINPMSAKLKVSALDQLKGILAPEDPSDATWLLENISDVVRRFATLRADVTSGTAKAYESRAKTALEDYFEWKKDPTTFKFARRSETDSDSKPRVKRERKREDAPPQEARPPQQEHRKHEESVFTARRTYPLGNAREFVFQLPHDGMTVADMKKVMCHLLTLATDFDLGQPAHAEAMSIILKQ